MTIYISSGVTSTLHVSGGNSFEVESGGVSTNSTIGNYCSETVDAGGKSINDTVTDVGQIDNSGIAIDTHVDDGAVLNGDAGLISGATISSGGLANVYDRTENLTVLDGGYAYLNDTADAKGDVISSGGSVALDLTISTGEVYTFSNIDSTSTEKIGGVTLKPGANLGYYYVTVDSGAVLSLTASSTISNTLTNSYYGNSSSVVLTVLSDAQIVGGGTVDGTLTMLAGAILSGVDVVGSIQLYSGATADDLSATITTSSASIQSGAVVDALVVDGQGYYNNDLTINGVASDVYISSRAAVVVDSGGVVDTVDVSSGNLDLSSGGSAAVTSVLNAGSLYVGSGAIATAVTVANGGDATIDSSGLVERYTVFGSLTDSGEAITGRISRGGVEYLRNGGVASATLVFAGGTLLLGAGGIAISGTVESGGGVAVAPGGKANATQVDAGGVLEDYNVVVSSGATVSTSIVSAETTSSGLTLMSGVRIGFDAPVVQDGGELILGPGGFALGVTVGHGMVLGHGDLAGSNSVNGGLISGARITDGSLLDEGLVEGVQVGGDLGAGELTVEAVASGVHLVAGTIFVGSADTKQVLSAVLSGAYLSGGALTVGLGGVASSVIVASGAKIALSGGLVSGVSVHAGGSLIGSGFLPGDMEGRIADGGLVSGIPLVSGGRLTVESGASAAQIGADSGTTLLIQSGGRAADLTTVRGGQLIDDGVAAYSGSNTLAGAIRGSGALVESGGVLRIANDLGGFDGRATISGGEIELTTSIGLGTAPIAFAAAGGAVAKLALLTEAQPANGATFAETLVNFGSAADQLDLARQAFVAGASAMLSGDLLTLVDGDYTASFVLSGSTAAGYQVTNDGAGGTLITAGASPAVLAQHMAAVGAGIGADVTTAADEVGSRLRSTALPFGHVSSRAA